MVWDQKKLKKVPNLSLEEIKFKKCTILLLVMWNNNLWNFSTTQQTIKWTWMELDGSTLMKWITKHKATTHLRTFRMNSALVVMVSKAKTVVSKGDLKDLEADLELPTKIIFLKDRWMDLEVDFKSLTKAMFLRYRWTD